MSKNPAAQFNIALGKLRCKFTDLPNPSAPSRVVLYLINRVNKKPDKPGYRKAWPSHAKIAADTGLGEATVERAIRIIKRSDLFNWESMGSREAFAKYGIKTTNAKHTVVVYEPKLDGLSWKTPNCLAAYKSVVTGAGKKRTKGLVNVITGDDTQEPRTSSPAIGSNVIAGDGGTFSEFLPPPTEQLRPVTTSFSLAGDTTSEVLLSTVQPPLDGPNTSTEVVSGFADQTSDQDTAEDIFSQALSEWDRKNHDQLSDWAEEVNGLELPSLELTEELSLAEYEALGLTNARTLVNQFPLAERWSWPTKQAVESRIKSHYVHLDTNQVVKATVDARFIKQAILAAVDQLPDTPITTELKSLYGGLDKRSERLRAALNWLKEFSTSDPFLLSLQDCQTKGIRLSEKQLETVIHNWEKETLRAYR